MIVENGKHYLYRHIRLDTNEVFYIGIGTKSKRDYKTVKSIYYRAHKIPGHNIVWNHIVAKTNYKVEILLESDDYKFIKKKEKEFIKIYGKKSYYGSLCNLTDGGDGTVGITRLKSKDNKFSKPIYQFNLNGKFIRKWYCGQDIERKLKYYANSIYDCCNRKRGNKTAYGFQWSYKKTWMKKVKRYTDKGGIRIYQYTKNLKYITSYASAVQAAKQINGHTASIINCVNGKKQYKTAHGFVWTKYKLTKKEKENLITKIKIRKSALCKIYNNSNQVCCLGCDKKSWYHNSLICTKCEKCSKCCDCMKKTFEKAWKLYNKNSNN